jgi:LCP family protein required for cell wall assembly
MNTKKFFKIVSSITLTFCLVISLVLIGVYLVNPGFFSHNYFLGKILPSSIDKPTNVLLLGLDKVSMSTDVMVVVHIDPKNKKVNVLSVPRDTKVKHDGKTCKINSIFVRGRSNVKGEDAKDTAGINLVKQVVGDIIGQKIDYVALAKPDGFKNIIDILDGVEVDIPRNMNYDDNDQNLHIHLKKGLQILDGDKAEQFVRYRHGYAEGDLGRIDAQQIFFKAFVDQKLKPRYILKADKILQQIFTNVKTDMNLSEAINYAMYAKDFKSENIKFMMLPGEPKRTSAAWYFVYNPEETQKLVSENFSTNEGDLSKGVN